MFKIYTEIYMLSFEPNTYITFLPIINNLTPKFIVKILQALINS